MREQSRIRCRDLDDRIGQRGRFLARRAQQMKGQAGGCLRSDARQLAKFVDQLRNRRGGDCGIGWFASRHSHGDDTAPKSIGHLFYFTTRTGLS